MKPETEEVEKKPLVSVLMLSYNHAEYIRQALDGCLAQETTFPVEIIVCDDASVDGTVRILREYALRHNEIVLSLQPANTGGPKNLLAGMRLVRGTYVAFCEGDDFWTNPRKLQKQVDFLESHPDFSVCCHRVEILFDPPRPGAGKQYVYKSCESEEARIRDGVFYADEAIANYYFHTSSMVFRWRFKGVPPWFRTTMAIDQFLFMLHAVEGKIKYFAEDMSVWRRHDQGYSRLQNVDKGLFFSMKGLEWIELYKEMDAFFSYRFTLQIRERILLALRNITELFLRNGQLDAIRDLAEKYGEYFEKPVLENAAMLDGIRLAFPEKREFHAPWAFRVPDRQRDTETDVWGTDSRKYAGGCLEPAITDIPEVEASVWAHWVGESEHACFSSADQALLAWLWGCVPYKKVWIPSCYPPSATRILDELTFGVREYEAQLGVSTSADFVRFVEPDEAVVTMDYLGRSVSPVLAKALRARPDIYWLEDRRHALLPENPSLAQAVLYDPTPFLGVPDGAILVGKGVAGLQPALPATGSASFREQVWNGLCLWEKSQTMESALRNRARLAKLRELPAQACSRLTVEILKRVPMRSIADARRKNWTILARNLEPYALVPEKNVAFAPFGFPVLPPPKLSVNVITATLRGHGIFCPEADVLHRKILILPCEHRSGSAGMETTAKLMNRFIADGIGMEDIRNSTR